MSDKEFLRIPNSLFLIFGHDSLKSLRNDGRCDGSEVVKGFSTLCRNNDGDYLPLCNSP